MVTTMADCMAVIMADYMMDFMAVYMEDTTDQYSVRSFTAGMDITPGHTTLQERILLFL